MPKQRQRKIKTITNNGTFDIETYKWTTYVLGGVKTHDGTLLFPWRRERELFEYILDFEGVLWGHNAGNYDTLWFVKWLLRYKEKATVFSAGQRITCLKVRKVELRDSYALIPLKLEKAAQIGGIHKMDTGLPCVCRGKNLPLIKSNLSKVIGSIDALGKTVDRDYIKGILSKRGCGGYCSIKRNMSKTLMSRLEEYLRFDLAALDATLDRVQQYGIENDIDTCGTIGSSSWNTAARTLSLPSANWHRKGGGGQRALYDFIKRAYFGGRTQLFWPHPPKKILGWKVDIVSSYPAALKELHLPWGTREELNDAQARDAYYEGKEGIFETSVIVPPMHIPPLPVRCKDRIAYPIGRLDGVWTGNELRYAESIGCTITRFGKSVVWKDSLDIFKTYCSRVWKLRDAAGTKSALGQWIKWLSNSTTGKLAQDPLNEECVIGLSSEDLFCKKNYDCERDRRYPDGLPESIEFQFKRNQNCPSEGSGLCCPHACDNTRHYSPMGMHRTIGVKKVWRMPDCAHIHWAAYLTAHARIKLHKCLVADGKGGKTAVYCDTDSVFSTTERTFMRGKEIGMFDLDGCGRWLEFDSHAPKTYAHIDPETGEYVARSKGFPDAPQNYHKLKEGVTIERGVKSLRMAAQGPEIFTRKKITRRITGQCKNCAKENKKCAHRGDRILLKDGLTHPVDVRYLTLHGTNTTRSQQSLPPTET